MKKLLLLNLFILLLISLSSCDSLCEKYGVHDLQYVSWNDHHWQECTRDGCNYKTEIVEHCGGKATCKSKAVCKDCGASYGELGDHDMLRKSCTDFAYCQICNFTDGKSNMHVSFAWVADDYLCVRYQKCEDCGFIAQEEPHHTPDEDGILCGKCGMNYLEASLVFHLNGDIQSYTLVDASHYELESIVIPETYKGLPVTVIGPYAFCFSPIKHAVLPDSIEVIDSGAFSISDLETIVWGSGIKEIRQDAFCGTALKSITIPGSVEVVEYASFASCLQLEEVVILDGVKRIEESAFGECCNLKTLILPNTLEEMHYWSLEKTPLLEYNEYNGYKYLGSSSNPYFAIAGGGEGETSLVMHPDTVFCISYSFFDAEDFVSIEIGPNLRYIGHRALIGMDSLEVITVAEGNLYYYVVNNLLVDVRTNIPVLGCKTSVISDDGSFPEIDLRIFEYIASLKTIYIPKGVKTLHLGGYSLDGLEKIIVESDVACLMIYGNNDGCRGSGKRCFDVFFCRTEDAYKTVQVIYTFNPNSSMPDPDCFGRYSTHYFYSETQPTTEGNYWHYVDGVPTPW